MERFLDMTAVYVRGYIVQSLALRPRHFFYTGGLIVAIVVRGAPTTISRRSTAATTSRN